MKLTSKWLLWFILVAVYASVIGGLFYYNLFKFVFDKQLQNEMVEKVRKDSAVLFEGISSRPRGEATFREAAALKDLLNSDKRIVSLVYFGSAKNYVFIRWHENTKFLGMSPQDYNQSVGLDSNAVFLAFNTREPRSFLTGNGATYDMAIPISDKNGEVVGIVNLSVSRDSARELIRSSMVRYALGAIIMMLLIGGVLYLFLLLKIIRPLNMLKDGVDSVSLNNLTFKLPQRNDEIGDVASSINALLDKIRGDVKGLENVEIMSLEKEQRWWEAILAVTVPKGSRAFVIDENNNVLYTNFAMPLPQDGRKVHILDIFDGRQQEIIQTIGAALENPTRVSRGNVLTKNVQCKVKAVQLPDDAGKNRIVLVIEPEK